MRIAIPISWFVERKKHIRPFSTCSSCSSAVADGSAAILVQGRGHTINQSPVYGKVGIERKRRTSIHTKPTVAQASAARWKLVCCETLQPWRPQIKPQESSSVKVSPPPGSVFLSRGSEEWAAAAACESRVILLVLWVFVTLLALHWWHERCCQEGGRQPSHRHSTELSPKQLRGWKWLVFRSDSR